MGRRARRRFPRWQRFPHRPLPYWWRGWFNRDTRLTSAELDAICKAVYTSRPPRAIATDRIAAPILGLLNGNW